MASREGRCLFIGGWWLFLNSTNTCTHDHQTTHRTMHATIVSVAVQPLLRHVLSASIYIYDYFIALKLILIKSAKGSLQYSVVLVLHIETFCAMFVTIELAAMWSVFWMAVSNGINMAYMCMHKHLLTLSVIVVVFLPVWAGCWIVSHLEEVTTNQ